MADVSDFEKIRKKKGMSPAQFYAIPREPPSSSKLPIFDEAHVRNAMSRFNQVSGISAEEMKKAHAKILNAAKKFGIEVSEFSKMSRGVNTMTKAIEALSEVRNSLDAGEFNAELKSKVLDVLDETIETLKVDTEVAETALSASKDEQISKLSDSLKKKNDELSEKTKLIEKLSASKAEADKKLETYAVKEKEARVNSLLENEIKAEITKLSDRDARFSELMVKDLVVLSEIEKVILPLAKMKDSAPVTARESIPSDGVTQQLSEGTISSNVRFETNGDVVSSVF